MTSVVVLCRRCFFSVCHRFGLFSSLLSLVFVDLADGIRSVSVPTSEFHLYCSTISTPTEKMPRRNTSRVSRSPRFSDVWILHSIIRYLTVVDESFLESLSAQRSTADHQQPRPGLSLVHFRPDVVHHPTIYRCRISSVPLVPLIDRCTLQHLHSE